MQPALSLAYAGPRGFFRGVQAANAVASLARDYIISRELDPPQTVLRKLFERLGATYIKLGTLKQFTTSWTVDMNTVFYTAASQHTVCRPLQQPAWHLRSLPEYVFSSWFHLQHRQVCR